MLHRDLHRAAIIAPESDDRLPVYLQLLLESATISQRMSKTAIAQQARQHQRSSSRLPIPLPPLPEQRAIATALSDVDALLGGLDRLIAKKRDLKQAAMQQLLTGQTRLPGFHGEWEVKRLGDVANIPDAAATPRRIDADWQAIILLHRLRRRVLTALR